MMKNKYYNLQEFSLFRDSSGKYLDEKLYRNTKGKEE